MARRPAPRRRPPPRRGAARGRPAPALQRVAAFALRAAVGGALLLVLGFVWFVLALPQPLGAPVRTDGVAVLTGGAGRIARGVRVLDAGLAQRMLVSGVDSRVEPERFRAVNAIPPGLFACCVDLGFVADSTRANAGEVAGWVKRHRFRSVRLVTAGYHMPRAEAEIRARVGRDVVVVPDPVPGERTLAQMAYEYAKFLAARAMLMVYPVPK